MFLVLFAKNGFKKNHELMLTIFVLLVSLFFSKKTSLHKRVFEEKKKCRLLGRTKKILEESMTLPSGERTFVSVFSVISLVFKKRKVLTVHGG